MAIVLKALIVCETDDVIDANQAVFTALNGAAFDSANCVVDFAIGVEGTVELAEDYRDGSFVAQVPGAELLQTANALTLPC